MPRRIPVRKNGLPLLLIPLATAALKATGIIAIGATAGVGGYSYYVGKEEQERRKNLPKLAIELENRIKSIEMNIKIDESVPTSLMVAPTDEGQVALRCAWVYAIAAQRNPQFKNDLLAEAKAELQYYKDEAGFFISYDNPYDPALQQPYLALKSKFDALGISDRDNMGYWLKILENTQTPDAIAEQVDFEKSISPEAELWNTLTNDIPEDLAKAAGSAGKAAECTGDVFLGLLTGRKPDCMERLEWIRLQFTVYGIVGLASAAYLLPPILKLVTPITTELVESRKQRRESGK